MQPLHFPPDNCLLFCSTSTRKPHDHQTGKSVQTCLFSTIFQSTPSFSEKPTYNLFFFHHLMFCLFYSAYTLPDRVFNSFHIHQRFFIQQLTLAQGKSLFAYYHLLRLKSWILYMNWLHYWKSLISTLKGRLGVFCSNAMSQGSIQHSTQMLNNGEVHIECICSSLWCKDE